MPLYEYECSACGRRFEALQRLSDEPLTTCKYCEGVVHRLISSSAVHFKGTGWYVTDYAQKSSAPPSENGQSKDDKSAKDAKTTAPASESKSESSKTADSPASSSSKPK